MKILHINNKDKMLNTLKNFYIYKETKANDQINDKGVFRQYHIRYNNTQIQVEGSLYSYQYL